MGPTELNEILIVHPSLKNSQFFLSSLKSFNPLSYKYLLPESPLKLLQGGLIKHGRLHGYCPRMSSSSVPRKGQRLDSTVLHGAGCRIWNRDRNGQWSHRSVTQPWKKSVREGAINAVLVNCLKQILFEKRMGEIDKFAHYADFL